MALPKRKSRKINAPTKSRQTATRAVCKIEDRFVGRGSIGLRLRLTSGTEAIISHRKIRPITLGLAKDGIGQAGISFRLGQIRRALGGFQGVRESAALRESRREGRHGAGFAVIRERDRAFREGERLGS